MLAPKFEAVSASRTQFERLITALQPSYASNARAVAPDHWMFEVLTGNGRSQVVHLCYEDGPAFRDAGARLITYSPVGPLPHRFDLHALLRRNAELDESAICIMDFASGDGAPTPFVTLRAIRPLASTQARTAWEMLQQTAHVADALEKEIFARDVY